ncbi:MAG: glycine--tRNA ligase subunit beta, partial [Candidatus Aerophobetes bacterium]|nr:glycine--tRNA ligase subunit beta [Candidatus Aerophobetes bacterium]
MSKTALLEIGVEELPSASVQDALTQLKEKGEELFNSFRLDYKRIISFGSSHRLILQVEGLSSRQRGKIEKEMGPPTMMV